MNAKHENQFVETSIYKEEKISMLLSQAIYAEFIYIHNGIHNNTTLQIDTGSGDKNLC